MKLFMDPHEFLADLERRLGRPLPVPPHDGSGDDCPVCRALGMLNGPEEGVVDVEGIRILTVKRPDRR